MESFIGSNLCGCLSMYPKGQGQLLSHSHTPGRRVAGLFLGRWLLRLGCAPRRSANPWPVSLKSGRSISGPKRTIYLYKRFFSAKKNRILFLTHFSLLKMKCARCVGLTWLVGFCRIPRPDMTPNIGTDTEKEDRCDLCLLKTGLIPFRQVFKIDYAHPLGWMDDPVGGAMAGAQQALSKAL